MTNIAAHPTQLRAAIVVEMITAMGIVMLGALLFATLENQNREIALVALGLYVIEAAILAASRIPAFSLLHTSLESVVAGHPANLQMLGMLFQEAQDFGYSLHMLPFSAGATLFCYLLLKSGYIPRGLALFGIIAAPLALFGTVGSLLGYEVPIFAFLPNLPFELTMGVWFLLKGVRGGSDAE